MQKVDLYQPIVHDKTGAPPITIRVGVQAIGGYTQGGLASSYLKPETYVLLSALPQELQQKVQTAIQAIIAGM
jgi:hypothetical protein